MKIVILDGYTENPGDLSWDGLEKLGELIVYDRTCVSDDQEIAGRMRGAQIVITNKTCLLYTSADLPSAADTNHCHDCSSGFNQCVE